MEKGFGGPVWHASARAADWPTMIAMTERALHGRGDHLAGEWREQGGTAYHLRRRLSAAECALAGGLTVRDLRRAHEGRRRLAMLFHEHPMLKVIAQHIGEIA